MDLYLGLFYLGVDRVSIFVFANLIPLKLHVQSANTLKIVNETLY